MSKKVAIIISIILFIILTALIICEKHGRQEDLI